MIEPGTIACIGLCQRTGPHRHQLAVIFGPPTRMTEAVFQDTVIKLAELYGLRCQWITDPRMSNVKGWPDLTIIGGTTILFRELKRQGLSLEPDQRKIGSLIGRGGDWACWNPGDLYRGNIEQLFIDISAQPKPADVHGSQGVQFGIANSQTNYFT